MVSTIILKRGTEIICNVIRGGEQLINVWLRFGMVHIFICLVGLGSGAHRIRVERYVLN